MDKSLVTNLVAALLVVAGFAVPEPWHEPILNSGLFALSGALTNWLAITMLFERIPGLYGSGVVPARFEEFKAAIRELVMEQFFSAAAMDGLFQRLQRRAERDEPLPGLEEVLARVDLDSAFDALLDMVMDSSLGKMLQMFGGREALLPLREPFQTRMREVLARLARDPQVVAGLRQALGTGLRKRVEEMVDLRLDELSPPMVKQIVQSMIRHHLGWLVVWGGVFGGLIGLLASLLLP